MNENQKPKQDQEDEASRDAWRLEFTKTIVKESFDLIRMQEKAYGPEFGNELRFGVLASYIATLVYEVVRNVPAGSAPLSHPLFVDLKEAIEMAITSGIEGSVREWTGQDLQFYSEISPEPVALNTEPC